MVTIRTFLAVAVAKRWELHQIEVHNAFLHGDLSEEIYMRLPPGFGKGHPGMVCRLHKSLYGLKQAPRCWFSKLTAALKKYGFVQSYADYSLFTMRKDAFQLHVLVYVDDLIIFGNDSAVVSQFKQYLSFCFHILELRLPGAMRVYFCLNGNMPYTLFLKQDCWGFVLLLFRWNRTIGWGVRQAPCYRMSNGFDVWWADYSYLSFAHPDLAYFVQVLYQFLHEPRQDHSVAALRVVKYLKGCPGEGIIVSTKCNLHLTGDSLISWKIEKQVTVSRSSAEAEYRSLAAVTCELKWLKDLLKDLGVVYSDPMDIADLFTKLLSRKQFEFLLHKLGIQNLHTRT
ncbi:transmembrane signal receptor [Lithospermum erythrorhizon]|uniref:Transmembrane signal receptor n=1 Tax=Lithospermum erythrorhizon TaxID=34254 RepID=A0AAV3NHC6_LITER